MSFILWKSTFCEQYPLQSRAYKPFDRLISITPFKRYCMSDASRCWQKGFIQSFYSLLWKNFNQSFFKFNGHKTTHRCGQWSQDSPWILLIISEERDFTVVFSKDLTCGFRQIKFGLFLPNTFVWIVFSLIFEKNLG